MASCEPTASMVTTRQGLVEVVLRVVTIVMGFATFVCAATAVNTLNADAVSLGNMEQSRDEAVTGTGIVVFMALLVILMETVIIVVRFCTDGVWNGVLEIVINILFALVYFCLMIPMTKLAHDWRSMESSSGVISNDVSTIGDSLAAASVFCIFVMLAFIMLTVWIIILLCFEWNTDPEVLEKSTSGVGEWCSSISSILDSLPGIVEVIIRVICIILGFPAFVSAATAVNILNANALSLGYWEQFRDKTVAVAGIVLFMGLLSILTEAVIIAMRFCTTGVFSVSMGMLTSCVYAVMYFCLGVSTAVFSEDWKNLENTSMGSGESGDTPDDVIMLISDSLAAASVFCFFSTFMLIVLSVWMFLFVINDWNDEFEQRRILAADIHEHEIVEFPEARFETRRDISIRAITSNGRICLTY